VFCREHDLGKVWPADNGFQCFPHAPGLVRKPDVSFVKKGRLPGDVSPDDWVKIAPDLAVEVVSPGDTIEEFDEKLDDYHRAGIPLVWVIYPKRRKARVIHLDGPDVVLGEDDELSGEDVIPGFRCPLRAILPRLAPAGEPDASPNGPGPS
jgi:Uma2 family endonuclease